MFFESAEAEIEYFLQADHRSKIWRTIGAAGPQLPRSFGGLYVIDQFHGKQPFIVNRAFVEAGSRGFDFPVKTVPTFVLDGSAVTPLHNYVSGRAITADSEEAVRSLITFAISPQGIAGEFDLNCLPYFAENLPKLVDANQHIMADYARSILAVRTLDREFFARHGRIRVDPERLALAQEEYKCDDFNEIAARVQARLQGNLIGYRSEMYAALLKVQIVRSAHGRDIDSAFSELFVYLTDRIDIVVARVMLLAMTFLAGDHALDRMLPYQREMPPADVFQKTRSTTWDLCFLGIPELSLAYSTEQSAMWCYLVTADKPLADLGGRFEVGSVARLFEDREYLWPLIGYHNTEHVASLCDNSSTFRHLRKRYTELLSTRMRRDHGGNVSDAIVELEREVENRYRPSR
jgi:hypothetical protein